MHSVIGGVAARAPSTGTRVICARPTSLFPRLPVFAGQAIKAPRFALVWPVSLRIARVLSAMLLDTLRDDRLRPVPCTRGISTLVGRVHGLIGVECRDSGHLWKLGERIGF